MPQYLALLIWAWLLILSVGLLLILRAMAMDFVHERRDRRAWHKLARAVADDRLDGVDMSDLDGELRRLLEREA